MQERHKQRMLDTKITMSLKELVVFCDVRQAVKTKVESAGDQISDDQIVQYLMGVIDVITKLDDNTKLVRELPRFLSVNDEEGIDWLVKDWLERFDEGK